MFKPKKITTIKTLTMGAFISVGCEGAEFGEEKENRSYQPLKLSGALKGKLTAYEAHHRAEMDRRRSLLREPRLFDLKIESEEKVRNRIGNAHIIGVKAHITLVNATKEQEESIRNYIDNIDWKGEKFKPHIIYNDKDEIIEHEEKNKHGNDVFVQKDKSKDIDEEDEDEKDSKKKDKNKLEDDEDEDEDLKPVQKKSRGLIASNANEMPEKQRAARGIYYPLYTELDPNKGQKAVLAPIDPEQASWASSSQVQKVSGKLDYGRWASQGNPHHQESLRKINFFCGKKVGA